MTIAIIAAMQKELDLILGLMRRQGDITTEEFEGVEIHRGRVSLIRMWWQPNVV